MPPILLSMHKKDQERSFNYTLFLLFLSFQSNLPLTAPGSKSYSIIQRQIKIFIW